MVDYSSHLLSYEDGRRRKTMDFPCHHVSRESFVCVRVDLMVFC